MDGDGSGKEYREGGDRNKVDVRKERVEKKKNEEVKLVYLSDVAVHSSLKNLKQTSQILQTSSVTASIIPGSIID